MIWFEPLHIHGGTKGRSFISQTELLTCSIIFDFTMRTTDRAWFRNIVKLDIELIAATDLRENFIKLYPPRTWPTVGTRVWPSDDLDEGGWHRFLKHTASSLAR
jgi:hypothetical protein